GITTVGWLTVTFLTPPTDRATLRQFYRLVHPGGPGWKPIVEEAQQAGEPLEEPNAAWDVPWGILCMFLGVTAVYSTLFATGQWIYGRYTLAIVLTAVAASAAFLLFKAWTRISTQSENEVSQ
ncbi:MAG: Na+:solute symporter, partial [Tunicatimonas sp.]